MRRMYLLFPLVLLVASVARAEPGASKEFAEKNFKWTLPSEAWSFVPLTAEQTSNHYVAAAECKEGGGIRAYVRVVAGGPTAEAIADEVRRGMAARFKETAQSRIAKGTLSGVQGSVVVLTGKAEDGTALWFRGFAVNVDKVLYQLLLEATKGAEDRRPKELDAAKRGFRLLKGAGPDEAPGALEPTGEASLGGFPPKGPKLEGSTAVLPSHNLRWTVPDGSPFEWTFGAQDETKSKQQVLGLRAQVARTGAQDGGPQRNTAVVALSVTPLEEGLTSQVVVTDPGLQKGIAKELFEGKHDTSKTRVEAERPVGNYKGSSVTLVGGADPAVHHFTFVAVCLKSIRYSFEISLRGGPDVLAALGPAVDALLAGVQFVEVKEHVRGPLAVPGVHAHAAPRGKPAESDTEFTVPGLTGKRPKGVAEIPFESKPDPDLRIAFEARAADGQTYFYFDVHTYDPQTMQKERMTDLEIITLRETAWRTAVGEDAVTVVKGKEPWFDATFAGVKGAGYQFSGLYAGFPFVEQGWVVRTKKNVIWIRMQFGGEGAEKAMEAHAALLKKVKPT